MPHVDDINDPVLAGLAAADNAAAKFAAIMWQHFIDGALIHGADLQDALIKSGLAEERAAAMVDIEETRWQGEIEVGDGLICLTAAGAEVVRAGRSY